LVVVTPHVWSDPALIERNAMLPATAIGVALSVAFDPLPSAPHPL
jgi:hypothetical protein